jgi:hypothetical protein
MALAVSLSPPWGLSPTQKSSVLVSRLVYAPPTNDRKVGETGGPATAWINCLAFEATATSRRSIRSDQDAGRKRYCVDGVPCRAADVVGRLKAVLFSAGRCWIGGWPSGQRHAGKCQEDQERREKSHDQRILSSVRLIHFADGADLQRRSVVLERALAVPLRYSASGWVS